MNMDHLPVDHEERMLRANRSIEGLSVGDAYGTAVWLYGFHELEGALWPFTDDTVMAINIVRVLGRLGRIDQNQLAEEFALSYMSNPRRGYGHSASKLLAAIARGKDWRLLSRASFGGNGSMGNGGAMRVGPLGAYFAQDETALLVEQARLSAEVTHAHAEAQAGAIAVALAAAFASTHDNSNGFLEFVMNHTPETETRDKLIAASALPGDAEPAEAAEKLGNGSNILAQDTVPLAVWLARRNFGSYQKAIEETAGCGGDMDTNCAIVGGIVALSAGEGGVPLQWLRHREMFHI